MESGAEDKFHVGATRIISSRDGSSPASSWSEDLCLKRVSDTEFELFVGGYEFVAEVSDFFNEETEEEEVPEEIGGYPVQGIQEGYVIGGEILKNEGNGEVQFSDPEISEVKEWLASVDWNTEQVFLSIKTVIKS